jgi:hypothetical protein
MKGDIGIFCGCECKLANWFVKVSGNRAWREYVPIILDQVTHEKVHQSTLSFLRSPPPRLHGLTASPAITNNDPSFLQIFPKPL